MDSQGSPWTALQSWLDYICPFVSSGFYCNHVITGCSKYTGVVDVACRDCIPPCPHLLLSGNGLPPVRLSEGDVHLPTDNVVICVGYQNGGAASGTLYSKVTISLSSLPSDGDRFDHHFGLHQPWLMSASSSARSSHQRF